MSAALTLEYHLKNLGQVHGLASAPVGETFYNRSTRYFLR